MPDHTKTSADAASALLRIRCTDFTYVDHDVRTASIYDRAGDICSASGPERDR